eukprot:scaffold12705_cov106-Isochrysis_galbana.AAC.2
MQAPSSAATSSVRAGLREAEQSVLSCPRHGHAGSAASANLAACQTGDRDGRRWSATGLAQAALHALLADGRRSSGQA